MEYFVKKHIKKNLLIKNIAETSSFILLSLNCLYVAITEALFQPVILSTFSFLFSFIFNKKFIKKMDAKKFMKSLITTVFLIPIGILINLELDGLPLTKFILPAYITLMLISFGISVYIQMILLKPEKQNLIIQRAKEEEIAKQQLIVTSLTTDSKNRLFGMIRLKKTLNLKETSEKLGLPEGEIENLLFDLAGEKKISGDFKDGFYRITSDVDEFIGQLDGIFSEWSDNEKTKHMKI